MSLLQSFDRVADGLENRTEFRLSSPTFTHQGVAKRQAKKQITMYHKSHSSGQLCERLWFLYSVRITRVMALYRQTEDNDAIENGSYIENVLQESWRFTDRERDWTTSAY